MLLLNSLVSNTADDAIKVVADGAVDASRNTENKLYRDVAKTTTEKAKLAKEDIAKPRDSKLDIDSLINHVEGSRANADVTSWTTKRAVAKRFSRSSDIILEIDAASVANKIIPRPNVPKYVDETEVLLKGIIKATPTKP